MYSPSRPRISLDGCIALLSAAALLAYPLLRYGWQSQETVYNLPLFVSLLFGGVPLVFELGIKLWKRDFGADLLAGLSIVSAALLGEYLAGVIVVFMLSGGHALEHYAIGNASSALKALAKRMPSKAQRLENGQTSEIEVADIRVDDTLVVFPHQICPADGIVLDGHGTMDEAYLTGEPFQIDKAPGSEVISGAVNGDTALTIRAVKVPADSRYAKIVEVIRMSEKNKPHIRRLGDRLGAIYTPLALAVAAGAWALTGEPVRFLAVLVVATPCPLIIAIPVAVIGSISLAAKRGLIIKNPTVLEEIDNCRTAIFDKTGTLTYGEPRLSECLMAPGLNEKNVLGLAASLERYSKHPLAPAIREAARLQSAALYEVSEVHEIPGQGLQGVVSGKAVQITGRKSALNTRLRNLEQVPQSEAGLECLVAIDGAFAALLRFRDTPRAEGRSFIHHLGPKHGLVRSLLVSGDRASEVEYLARLVGITEIYAGKSPEEKLQIVRSETQKDKTLYVGDGINDAPALMAATVGIAIGRNSDITSESAGAVVLDNSLAKVDELIHIGRRMKNIALQSAVGGMALSIIGMLVAAGGHLPPVLGALTQEGIDLLAILNALRVIIPIRELTDFEAS